MSLPLESKQAHLAVADGQHDSTFVPAAQRVVRDLFGSVDERKFGVRYWDGTSEWPAEMPRFSLDIRRPSALRRMLVPPSELSIVEAYLYGDIDIDGDIEAAASLGDIAVGRIGSLSGATHLLRDALELPTDEESRSEESAHARVARRLIRFGREHSSRRDAAAVRFHYDVGNAFYALWLDRRMVYSCGYFARGDESLDDAQVAKLDLVCRKLRLTHGERLLDIGCGWGALVIHAAKHYGAQAVGITLSEQQAAWARERVAREGLSDRVTISVRDYRTLNAPEAFDKISSVGMVEHVGLKRLPDYFDAAYRVLAPGGLFLNHGIISIADARPHSLLNPLWRRLWRRDQFIRRYVFPDGDLVPSARVIASAEEQGFELRDVESLRDHYVTTLRHWVHRLEEHEHDARRMVGDVTYRVWRLYMAASAHGFASGRIGIIQSLLAKPDAEGRARVPRTRDDLYASKLADTAPTLEVPRAG
ncbi:MAG TPA: cyclopropane-fatty-acyl-phospholipid synthase family protein [Gemmatimonadaceae bacterium]